MTCAVVTKNFVLDDTGRLDLCDRPDIDLKLVQASILIRVSTLSVSAVLSSHSL